MIQNNKELCQIIGKNAITNKPNPFKFKNVTDSIQTGKGQLYVDAWDYKYTDIENIQESGNNGWEAVCNTEFGILMKRRQFGKVIIYG